MLDILSIDPMLLLLIIGFVIAFILAFGMGANDVANSFGTSVGSKTLTFQQACILATIFETMGSVLLGSKVSGTIAKGIVDLNLYSNRTVELQTGYLSSLCGASGWLLIATLFKLPVSGTHSIVGAVLGFTLIANGLSGIRWISFMKVVCSWFTSPILSGIISAAIFKLVRKFVLTKKEKLRAGSKVLPFFYGLTLAINAYMISDTTFTILKMKIPKWVAIAIGFILGSVCFLISRIVLMPWILKRVASRKNQVQLESQLTEISDNDLEMDYATLDFDTPKTPTTSPNKMFTILSLSNIDSGRASFCSLTDSPRLSVRRSSLFTISHETSISLPTAEAKTKKEHRMMMTSLLKVEKNRKKDAKLQLIQKKIRDQETNEINHMFSFIQVLTAIFASFAHGGNDVSNAVGPIIGMFSIYRTGQIGTAPDDAFQWLLLLFGGVGISIGLWLLGKRVMATIGHDLTAISPASGFCIEFGAALTVLIASHLGIPVSTTHCLVGSVVFVGFVRSRQGVDWKIFRNIIFSWGVTVPAACAISAASYLAFGHGFAYFIPNFFNVSPHPTNSSSI